MDPFVTPAKNLYKDFDKGFVPNGITEHHYDVCSPEFRAALLNDFKYILRHYICDQHGLNDQAVKDCLGDMIAECTRLYYNPLLFESRDLEDKFFKEVNDIVSGISEYIKDERKDRQADLKMARLAGRIWEKETRPLYKPGKTPWGQFLENGAPGSGIASVVPGPLLTMQVVPPAGSELYFLWRKAAAQLKFCIKSSKPTAHGRRAKQTMLRYMWDRQIAKAIARPKALDINPRRFIRWARILPCKDGILKLERLNAHMAQMIRPQDDTGRNKYQMALLYRSNV